MYVLQFVQTGMPVLVIWPSPNRRDGLTLDGENLPMEPSRKNAANAEDKTITA